MSKFALAMILALSAWVLGCATAGAPVARCTGSPSGDAVVATTRDGPITEAELNREIARKPKVASQLYAIRRDALEGMILQRLVEEEAARRKETPEALVTSVAAAKPPTDAEVKQFFDERLAGGGYKLDEVKGQIVQHLTTERRKAALIAFLDDLKAKAHVAILLLPPKVDVATDGPSRGAEHPKVTIVEFSDFQCPYCKAQEAALHRILAEYPRDVRLVFRDFPLDIHPDAQRAAQAGACADEQGKFWPMHDILFEHASALGASDLSRYARDAGLDGPKFDRCLASGETEKRIEASREEGERDGVEGTPALFVNGRPLPGATSYEDLKAAVDEELADAGHAKGGTR